MAESVRAEIEQAIEAYGWVWPVPFSLSANLKLASRALAENAAHAAEVARQASEKAWDQAVRECHDLGWLHDFARSDAIERNPYRADRIGGE